MEKSTHAPRPRGRPPTGKSAQSSSVQALDRALGLLEILAVDDGLSLTDVALEADIAASTAHRLLSTLQARKFVELDTETGHWRIGVNAFQVGNAFLRTRKLVSIGRTVMRDLLDECGETVNIGIVDDGEVVFLSQFESHAPMRAFFRPGRRGPIHTSGIGKAIMATWQNNEISNFLENRELVKLTDKTIQKPERLMADLNKIRARGWSLDDEEQALGMRCIAAPLYNEYGEAVAGLSMSGPTARMTDDRLDEFGHQVREAAVKITQSMGGTVPFAAG